MEKVTEVKMTREKAEELLSFKNIELPVERQAQIDNFCKAKALSKIFQNKDMLDSAKILFKHNLNMSSAAKALYVHRNTLVYRIKKIKSLTGLNLRKLEDAVLFCNLLSYENTFIMQAYSNN